jgi:C4-dicarboxylate transporter DctM subunit
VKFGIDPLHFGIILSINLAVGMITPPFCANVFVAARISNVQVHHVFKYLGPILLFAMIPCLLLVTYIPQISLFLPKLFY